MELKMRELKGKILNLQDQLRAAQKELAETKNKLTVTQELARTLKQGLMSFADWRDAQAQAVLENLPKQLKELFTLKEIDALPVQDGEYEGSIWDGQPNGEGVARYQSGNAYQGTFFRGLRHGSGCMNYVSGDLYDGEWHRGSKQGFGSYVWASGDKYVGQFQDDMVEGLGFRTYADGRTFFGFWKDNKWNGYGIEVSQGGLMTTVGNWLDERLEGEISEFFLKDKLYYAAGKPQKNPTPNQLAASKATSKPESGRGFKPSFANGPILNPQVVNVREKSSTAKVAEGSTARTHKAGAEQTAGAIFYDPAINDMLNED